MVTVTKRHNSVNIAYSVIFLFSAHRLIMFYDYTKFPENITVLELRVDTISIRIKLKAHSSVNIAYSVIILVLCTSYNHGLHFTKFRENILNGFRVMERTQFQY